MSSSVLQKKSAFTLPEILVAVSIFAVVSTITATLYVRSFRESRRAATQNQIYDDARFILQRIAAEIHAGTVDYDEYYNQNVVIPSKPFVGNGLSNYGQNYGRYYSSFFNPGNDINGSKLGFDCNDASGRNKKTCTPLRRTIDRNTGENPFTGKYDPNVNVTEDAFCGSLSYALNQGAPVLKGLCGGNVPDAALEKIQDELYLISADGKQKTILARERIGANPNKYALAILKLNGTDTNNDGIPNIFVCAPDFQCRGGDAMKVGAGVNPTANDLSCFGAGTETQATDLPQTSDLIDWDLPCDPKSEGFSKDFVPISPLRINIKAINFSITPTEDPRYAFSETTQLSQPRVTISITVEPNTDYLTASDSFPPFTLIQTVSAGALQAVSAAVTVE